MGLEPRAPARREVLGVLLPLSAIARIGPAAPTTRIRSRPLPSGSSRSLISTSNRERVPSAIPAARVPTDVTTYPFARKQVSHHPRAVLVVLREEDAAARGMRVAAGRPGASGA